MEVETLEYIMIEKKDTYGLINGESVIRFSVNNQCKLKKFVEAPYFEFEDCNFHAWMKFNNGLCCVVDGVVYSIYRVNNPQDVSKFLTEEYYF